MTSGDAKLSTIDYTVMAVVLLLSVGSGIFVSVLKPKSSSLFEYFLAERKAQVPLILLSFFSTFSAGGMVNLGIEIYLFDSQSMLPYIILIPLGSLWLNYIIVPVFYRLQNISMLKYFEMRFGAQVHGIALVASVFQMLALGSVNLYVAVVVICQVSDLSFWVAATVMTAVCVIYSTLGGMRGIVLADAFQAGIMIISVIGILIASLWHLNSLNDIWRFNYEYSRFKMFDFSFDPTLRYTFWSSTFGYGIQLIAFITSYQALIQRCVMAPNLNSAKRIATVGNIMTFFYCLAMQGLGFVIFAYYKGCNLVKIGAINSINELIPHFTMEILHSYNGLPGIFFSSVLCATLSTISSLLNSISAVITVQLRQRYSQLSERLMTWISKLLVIISGILLTLGLSVMEQFQNIAQASIVVVAVIGGPILGVFCLGICCPQINHKCVTFSFYLALLFGFWQLIGTVLVSHQVAPSAFALCNSTRPFLATNITMKLVNETEPSFEAYFPLAKVTFTYLSLELFLVTFVCSLLLSHVTGRSAQRNVAENLDLYPDCVVYIQRNMSRRLRRIFFCDVRHVDIEHVEIPLVDLQNCELNTPKMS